MQTQNGGDAANLRWQNKSADAVDASIAEDQSSDNETSHVAETVGYLAIDPAPLAQDAPVADPGGPGRTLTMVAPLARHWWLR